MPESTSQPVNKPPYPPVHHLFEAQVTRTPGAVALHSPAGVAGSERRLTYAQLNHQANRLAHHLQNLGVGPDQIVGLYLDRSPAMMVALLAVLKAGGAYLPLDRAYPAERLAYMVAEAQLPLILTQERLLDSLPPHQAQVINLDRQPLPDQIANPTSPVTADHLAYVLFTSGSTGRPKGVAMRHGPLTNLIRWQVTSAAVGPGARTLQFSPLSFDVSFQESLATWSSGGTLVLISDALRRDALALLRFLVAQHIERLFLPFVALQNLAEIAHRRRETAGLVLREVITAGEQLQITQAIADFFTALPGCLLHNQYGPTESHVVTAHTLTGSPATWPTLPPIGQPISNAQIHLLDDDLRPVPAGQSGHLYIGGDCLARGYLNRPALTAERFIDVSLPSAHPSIRSATQDAPVRSGSATQDAPVRSGSATQDAPSQPDSVAPPLPTRRLYKTGDLAQATPDGTLLYLGRADDQVKIRGFRVELGEIEALISEEAAVREVAVAAWEAGPGDKRLVAYIAPHHGEQIDRTQMRTTLSERLPDYMLPAQFDILTTLPRTPSGKIDRRALPDPNRQAERTGPYQPPQTPTEQTLSHIWADLLHLDRVGQSDNFFALGGHSLLATQMIARLRDTLHLELPLPLLFETATLADLARHIDVVQWAIAGRQATPPPGPHKSGTL